MESQTVEWVRRARDGDPVAFADLLRRYEGAALAVAHALLRNPDAAADAVQESMLRAWRRLDDLEDERRFPAWLCGIVRNYCTDILRRRPVLPLDEAAVQMPGREGAPDDGLKRREREQRIERALDQLDEVSRAAVVLRYFEDMSSKQIGEMLKLSPAAVDMRLSRARQELRPLLADLLEEKTVA